MHEATPGYIYILQNESLAEDRLKIGRTAYDPNLRAGDISSSTGVPTPFEVIWSDFSDDCVMAEALVHAALAEYRTNPRREFFDVGLEVAIAAARKAIAKTRRYADWWDLATKGERTLGAFIFHTLFRPLARLPVVVILLALWIIWKFLKEILLLPWRFLRLLGRLFFR